MKDKTLRAISALYSQGYLNEVNTMAVIAAVSYVERFLQESTEDSFAVHEFKRIYGTIAYNILKEDRD